MAIRFEALSSHDVHALQQGGPDAYGSIPRYRVSDGHGVPCRHCLQNIDTDAPYLVVAFRPFETLQPYAETGPIFLHADACERAVGTDALPAILTAAGYIVRGYDVDEVIVYGTGAVVPTNEIAAYAERILSDRRVAFVHVRSARNNCFLCRIERG